ncbi:methionine/alanine import family NSS transporter small subunit [Zhihengliuella flava]|uniref:Methionine/alanine importer small subunit n=1 Tax=Zhihengliuella flava TaxID=1285193 RepID=A0A931GG22_9MICC|nr:methionine/alanine import family NSS transporter small subunit [Zhihengliuella flava]MBG6085307.1 hypothetical protein [Zhihengliuella flava]
MTATAIIVMIIALVVVWGGLVAALVNLSKHPEEEDDLPVAVAPENS